MIIRALPVFLLDAALVLGCLGYFIWQGVARLRFSAPFIGLSAAPHPAEKPSPRSMLSTMELIFIILVVIGFAMQFVATWPNTPYASRIAWGSWLVAAIIWAVLRSGLHT